MEIVSKITGLAPTKSGIKDAVARIASAVAEGNMYGTEAMVLSKALEEVAKGIRASPDVSAAVSNEQGMSIAGATIKETIRTTHKFDNSPAWLLLNAQAEEIKAKMKEIEDQAKVIKSPIFDPETGELLIAPSEKEFTGAITVTLAK